MGRLLDRARGIVDAHAVEVTPTRRLVTLEHTDDRGRTRPVGKLDPATGKVYTLTGAPSDPIKPNGRTNRAHLQRIRAAKAHPLFPRAVRA